MRVNPVVKNASWIIACRLVQSVFALIVNALSTRYFGPSNYGVISYAASLVAFVTPLMKLGISDIIVNELIKAPQKEGEIIGSAITLNMISSAACVLGLYSFANIANHGDHTTILVVLLYSLLLFSYSFELVQYWFHAKYLSKVVSITSLVVYFVVTIYRIFLLFTKKSIFWFASSNAIDHLLIAVILLFFYSKKDGRKLTFSKIVSVELLKKGSPYIIPELMGLVLEQSDRIMLQFLCGDSEVGLYSAAISTAGMSSFIFSAIVVAFRPLILESKLCDERKYEKNIIKLYGIVLYLALLQSIFITLFGEHMVNILYGNAFLPSVPMLRIVIWYTLFSYIGAVRTVWILAENKQNYLWIISLSGMLLNLVLNAILISYYGGKGAAIATLITQMFTNIVVVFIIKPLRANIYYILRGLNPRNIWDKLH